MPQHFKFYLNQMGKADKEFTINDKLDLWLETKVLVVKSLGDQARIRTISF